MFQNIEISLGVLLIISLVIFLIYKIFKSIKTGLEEEDALNKEYKGKIEEIGRLGYDAVLLKIVEDDATVHYVGRTGKNADVSGIPEFRVGDMIIFTYTGELLWSFEHEEYIRGQGGFKDRIIVKSMYMKMGRYKVLKR